MKTRLQAAFICAVLMMGVPGIAVGTAGAASLAAGPAASAGACEGTWQRQDAGLAGIRIYDVTALDAAHTWVVGTAVSGGKDVGVIASWDGTSWQRSQLPLLDHAYTVRASSADDIWILGDAGPDLHDVVLHGDGTHWAVSVRPDQLGAPGAYLNAIVPVTPDDVWAFGGDTTPAGESDAVAEHYDGHAWSLVSNSLATAPYSVVLAAGLSPSGEVWVVGEDVVGYPFGTQPPQRVGYAGVVVGGHPQRVSMAAVPGEVNNEPLSMTWDAAGHLVVAGASGDDLATGVIYPFSGVRSGTAWTMQAAPTPVAGFTELDDVARIGASVWSVGDPSIAGREWSTLERLGPSGWSTPVQLAQFQGTRPIALTGLPSGQGWLVTWQGEAGASHVWSTCSGVPASSATASSASATSTAPTVRPSGPRDRLASGEAARATTTSGAGISHPVSGPVIDRLEAAGATKLGARSAAPARYVAQPVCPTAPASAVQCLAQVVTPAGARAAGLNPAGVSPADGGGGLPFGYGPSEFRQAYGLPATGGAGRTVAIVGAYGDPRLAADLAVYRKAAGLAPCAVASGCLRIVDEHGGSALPAWDPQWALEQSLDVQAVSAVCADCRLLVVQADSPFDSDIGAANQTAAALGASVINNSFGQGESASDPAYAATFVPKGVTLVAAAGDVGLDAEFPAAVPRVVGVGGTTLLGSPGSARGWRETAWRYGSGGCSSVETKPAWQTDPLCSSASTIDVSADADPASGAAVYDSKGLGDGQPGGWFVVGGTSLAAPLVAGIIALRGASTTPASYWSGSAHTYDVPTGFNGWCAPLRECTATSGYDGATGWGSPAP